LLVLKAEKEKNALIIWWLRSFLVLLHARNVINLIVDKLMKKILGMVALVATMGWCSVSNAQAQDVVPVPDQVTIEAQKRAEKLAKEQQKAIEKQEKAKKKAEKAAKKKEKEIKKHNDAVKKANKAQKDAEKAQEKAQKLAEKAAADPGNLKKKVAADKAVVKASKARLKAEKLAKKVD
jgi:colicin import membrane protein